MLAPCAETPSTAQRPVTVPDVIGYPSSWAAEVFAKACLNAGYSDPVGTRVISESPPDNSTVPEYDRRPRDSVTELPGERSRSLRR